MVFPVTGTGIWQEFLDYVDHYSAEFLIMFAVFALIFLVAAIVLSLTAFSLKRRYRKLVDGSGELDMEALLNNHGERIRKTEQQHQQVGRRLDLLETQSDQALAGIGLVRFNAFRETGSDLSFSLALVDRRLNGVVVTSIFGRDENRFYGKPIRKGESEILLGEEEQAALEEAAQSMRIKGVGA